ncbi:MAG TPA: biotin/lipoyl-containing protein, partial [Terriglobales bacterium]|nr:biotin/lipoyl-containing protein [Terriglobales bacterium]
MPIDIVMPQMGESIVEGTITKWLKKPGDKIRRDEPLFEISTDKVDAEIPAPASGTLQDIKVSEGATVQVNTVVGTIAADGEATTASPAKSAAQAQPEPPEKKKEVLARQEPREPVEKETVADDEDDHTRSSPLVR